MERNDNSQAWMSQVIGKPEHVESESAGAATLIHHRPDTGRARETPCPGQPFSRQAAPCFEGGRTDRRLRPFLRRRLKTARPQRVRMRARNPCFLTRLRLRGRYVGLPMRFVRCGRENYLRRGSRVKVDFSTNDL